MKYSEVKQALDQIDKDELKNFIEELGEDVVIYYLESLDDMAGVIDDLPRSDAHEIIKSACACHIPLRDVVYAYEGSYRSNEAFTRDLVKEMGGMDSIPSYLHIDWEGTARDLMIDYSEDNGYYFRDM